MGLLKTDYKNDVLDLTVNTDRKFQQIDNGDGSLSFADVTAYQTVGDVFGMNDINTTNKAINDLMGGFATVEEAATASKHYDVGDFLVYNEKMYKVTAEINSGNALVVDGNIEVTTVGAEVAALNNDLTNKLRRVSVTITTANNGAVLLSGSHPDITGYNVINVVCENSGYYLAFSVIQGNSLFAFVKHANDLTPIANQQVSFSVFITN